MWYTTLIQDRINEKIWLICINEIGSSICNDSDDISLSFFSLLYISITVLIVDAR